MHDHDLNYHHLRYFWAVAKDGNLTRTARRLHVSQSALSTQIKQLEEHLGHKVFRRQGRTLEMTEAGKLALAYADDIFRQGTELVATLNEGRKKEQSLRLGAVATLSRNFQESLVKPMLNNPDVNLRLLSGGLGELLAMLGKHELDLVLSNRPTRNDRDNQWICRRIARQQVSLVGHPNEKPFRFPRDLAKRPLLLPGPNNEVRTAFDALCAKLKIQPKIFAEVDDMAMMRLLTRDTNAVGLLPSVVVRDELVQGKLREYCTVPDLFESFYVITVQRRFEHPLLQPLLARSEKELLAME